MLRVCSLDIPPKKNPWDGSTPDRKPGNEEEKYELAVALNCFLTETLPMEHGNNRGSILANVLPSIDAATEGNDNQGTYIRAHQGVDPCSCNCQSTESLPENSLVGYVNPNQRHSAVGTIVHNTRRLLSCVVVPPVLSFDSQRIYPWSGSPLFLVFINIHAGQHETPTGKMNRTT